MTLTRLEYAGFHAPNGGNLHVVQGVSPSPLRIEGWGIGFGPLRIAPWADSTVVIDELTFESVKNDSLFSLFTTTMPATSASAFGAAFVAASVSDDGIDPTDRSLTRRSFLVAAGTSALLAGAVTAQEDGETYNVAKFSLDESPRGIHLRVDDVVADYLPPDQTFYVEVDGTDVGSFTAGKDSLTINPGITGEVTISSDDALSFIDKIIAKYTAEDELHYSFNPVDEEFSAQTVDDEVVISDQPILVEPIREADPKETLLQIDGETIPHADDEQGALGYWYLRDGQALVYVVGEDAPDSTLIDVHVNIGRIERLKQRF